jgi:PAS domain S-box-containing protein
MKQNHYLKTEFYERIKKDSIIFDFLEENSLDGVWYWDLENPQNEWMSPKFWQVLGYLPEEKKHLASQWQEIIFPEDLKKATENFNKHYENPNHPYDQIVRYKHKKGHTIWVRCRGNIIRDNQGKPIRMIGVHNDITEEKYNEENLIQKTNYLKAILDSSLDGIMAFDSLYDENGEIIDFIYTMSNKKACSIVKLREEELIGQRLSKMLSGNFIALDSLNGQSLFDIYKEVVLTGESKSLEFYFESNGIKEWFRNKTVKYEDGFICTFEIITEEKYFQEKLEQKLEQKVEEEMKKRFKQERLLIQQSKMATMGEMMAAIAHNWRQPLNTISLLSASITKKLLNSKLTKDYIDNWIIKMNNQVNFMSQTIDDFRNFYKPEEEFKKVSLKKIISKVISLINLQLNINNIKIEANIPESILIMCLENQLQQALINILINSKEAIISKNIINGMILLSASEDDSFVNLIIQDNGGGIEKEENFTSIFEPYFTTKANSHGTGIGLYMTKIIIEQNMKGKIETKNINNGFEFTIKIPC